MNKRVKTRWVKALRSGKYKQGRHSLRNVEGDTFCCLGVLCDLAVRSKVIKEGRVTYLDPKRYTYGASSTGNIPPSVEKWSGLDSYFDADLLIKMNDGGESFELIADYVEENL